MKYELELLQILDFKRMYIGRENFMFEPTSRSSYLL